MDDFLAVSHLLESIMKDVGFVFDIKDNKYGPPTDYLGANVEPLQISDRKYSWSIKCDSYVAAAVQMIKYLLYEDYINLKSGKRPHKGPLPNGCKPELDVTDECDAKHVFRFYQLIGIFQWSVGLVSIGIQIEVVLLF